MKHSNLRHTLAASLLSLGCAASAQAAGWTLTELGTLGGATSAADAINASGHVVGYADGADGVPYPVIWIAGVPRALSTRPGRATAIGSMGVAAGNVMSADGLRLDATLLQGGAALDLGTFGGSFSVVSALNDRGQVVGFARTVDEKDHAFLASASGMIDLGTFGGAYSYAAGISQAGLVVGSAYDASGTSRCFLSSGAGLFDPGTLGGRFCSARAVNDAGQVTGGSTTGTGLGRAFRYDGQALLDLGTLGGSSSAGYAINRYGHVVGAARTASNEYHAFLHDGTRMRDLGGLGGTLSVATAVNARGQVVGYATLPSGVKQPFFYADGVMVNVNSLVPGLSGVDPNRISLNDAGQIAGTGLIAGALRGFVLTPTP